MLKRLKKVLSSLGLCKSKQEYNLRVVEYYDFNGQNLNEWCLLRRATGNTDEETWFCVVGDGDETDKEVVIFSNRPGWQGYYVWLDLGTRSEDWTGAVGSSARRASRRNSQTWVANVVADLVKDNLVDPSCLTKLEYHRSMDRLV